MYMQKIKKLQFKVGRSLTRLLVAMATESSSIGTYQVIHVYIKFLKFRSFSICDEYDLHKFL